MNDKSEKEQRIANFKTAIKKKWGDVFKNEKNEDVKPKCQDVFCDLSPLPSKGWVYVFDLPKPPATHPGAKKCFAWIGRSFISVWGDGFVSDFDKGEVVVLDVQVPCDEDLHLPRMAVLAWRTGSLISENESDFVDSKKWSWDCLIHKPVRFEDSNGATKNGNFLVRRRPAEGKFSVRIVHDADFVIEGTKVILSIKSFGLTQRDIDDGITRHEGSLLSFRRP
jgi:hypothetical protein